MAATTASPRSVLEDLRELPSKKLAKQALNDVKGDDVPGLAAEIAYHAIFAIPPMIIFIITLAAALNQFTGVPIAERLRDAINTSAPGDTKQLLNSLVDKAVESVNGGVASFGVALAAIVALWSGSNGVATLIKAFNRAYDVTESRSWIKKKLLALGLTFLLAILVNAAFIMFVFGGQIGRWVAGKVGLGSAFTTTWDILRWPLAIIFIMFVLALLYYFGPNVEQTFRWMSPGSIVATILWVLVVLGFKLYLTLANPGSAYGALGSVVVLLYFLFLTGIVFVLGAEINAIFGRRYDPETVAYLAEHPNAVETTEDQAEAHRRAREMDQREGTHIEEQARQRGAAPVREARRPPTADKHKPGRLGAFVSALGGLAVAVILAAVKRRNGRERGR